ncbi:MAG: 4'-phosphopantetheinyl transferase family protein [Tumebacillaceae bacterium]
MTEIQIYWVKIPESVDMTQLASRLDILNEEEQGVYDRYRVDFKKVEFLIGRLLLKNQLAERLQIDPQTIQFDKNQYGKLLLEDRYYDAAPQKVHFNLSHTDKMIVCAFTTRGEVGIDVEYAEKNHLSVMPSVYVPHEIAHVEAQPTQADQLREFYLLWTRKEAYIKAIGTGFSLSPLTFTVPLEFGRAELAPWEYYTFQPEPGYMISSALEKQPDEEIHYHIQELSFDDVLQARVVL